MLYEDRRYCAWCSVKLKWWRTLLSHFCGDCLLRPYGHDFHSRVGMREK